MSLVCWYPLIDGSLENKGLDTTPLTLHGTVPFTNGRVRTAPTFSVNSSNYYTMPPITKTNDFSVCCWVKCSSIAISWIFWQGVIGSINLGFNITPTGRLRYVCSPKIVITDLPLNTWVHVCMTMDDNGYMNCYLNGENVGSASTNGFNYTEGDDLYIGLARNIYPLNGQLQDFRYYDHCLSPKEVKEIARGLCLHLPLKGVNARPNLFKNSATMFDNIGGAPVSNANTSNPTLVFDENAPCGVNGKVLRATISRPDEDTASIGGYFYITSKTGIPTLTIGSKYCVSVWARCTATGVIIQDNPMMEGHTKIDCSKNIYLTSEWKRYYAIFTAVKETSTSCFYVTAPIGAEGILEYCCPKLELLSPTPYIPNIEDSQYSDYVLDYEPDCSGNEFDTTRHGDLTTSDSNGRYNTAVAFNGTDAYLQGIAPTNSECKEFTIATWVKLNNVSVNQAIYTCRTKVGSGLVLFYLGASGGIRLNDGTTNAIFPNSTLEPNKWYHIAVTRDTTARKLYINGEFVSSATTTGALSDMGTMYQVGESNAQTSNPIGNFLNADLSDLRLYTSVLSVDEVKELYETSASIAHNTPSLTESAYYDYIETQKHSTFDKSKFTIVGSPTITDDGIVSGFSTANKISIPVTIDTSKNWIIKGKFKTPESTNINTYYMISSLETRYSFRIQMGRISAFADFPSVPDGGIYLLESYNADTWYDYEYGCNGTEFFARIKESSNSTWDVQKENTLTKQDTATRQVYIGEYASGYPYLAGFIDLSQYSISVDGVEIFNGNTTGIDTIKADDYTIIGTPTISDDGIASGFATTSYLTIPKEVINSLIGHNWKIEYKIKKPTNELTAKLRLLIGNKFAAGRKDSTIAIGRFNQNNLWFMNVLLSDGNISTSFYTSLDNNTTDMEGYLSFDGTKYINAINDNGAWKTATYETTLSIKEETSDVILGYNLEEGSIDLNAFKIYVDSELVYQPCLKIPYTLGSTGIKVVDNAYLSRVQDVYDQHYLERYYTINETTQTVYEYPLFRDSMHTYEFDEGLQASITKTGIHNATTLTEATKTSIQQNNTNTVTLIEN